MPDVNTAGRLTNFKTRASKLRRLKLDVMVLNTEIERLEVEKLDLAEQIEGKTEAQEAIRSKIAETTDIIQELDKESIDG